MSCFKFKMIRSVFEGVKLNKLKYIESKIVYITDVILDIREIVSCYFE